MLIIGLDYHPSFQQITFVDNETGEYGERGLLHQNGEAERFYRELKQRGVEVRIGMEATGHSRWFERLIAELDFELWIGDPAQIKAKRVRKQKTDREDGAPALTATAQNIQTTSPQYNSHRFPASAFLQVAVSKAPAHSISRPQIFASGRFRYSPN